jgi:hypothetical protein
MFLINPYACIVAVIFEIILYLYLHRRAWQKQWGDVRAGFWIALARFSLLRLRNHSRDPRNWRPIILLFSGDVAKRISLVRLANWFNQNRGLVTACQIIIGELENESNDIKRKQLEMEKILEEEQLVAFSEVDVVQNYENGVINIIQSSGIAGLQSNTVMFGWPEKPERLESILRIMRVISWAGKSTIIARPKWAHEPGQEKHIDIWWRGKHRNGDLMLLLAYLLNLNPEWNDAKIMVRSIVESEQERAIVVASLSELIPETRIRAETNVIIKPAESTVFEIMQNCSKEADIVFLGLMIPQPGNELEYGKRLIELASRFKTTIFVLNAGEFAGRLI